MGVTYVQYNKGGTLRHTIADVPPDGARWTGSPTAIVYDSGGTELKSSTAATAGPSTTLGGACSAGMVTLSLTSTSTLERWREYIVGPNSDGQWEWVTLESKATTTVTVRDELLYGYATGDTFKSHDLLLTMTATDCDSLEKNAWVQWAYTIAGEDRFDQSTFHISRYSPRCTVTPQDILRYNPKANDTLGSRQRLEDIIKEAWEGHVLVDMGQMFDPGALVSADALRVATIYKTLELIAGHNEDYEEREQYEAKYKSRFEADIMITGIDLDQSGGQDEDEVIRNPMCGRMRRG